MHHLGAERLSFSAIRVCQPGPDARQRSMTSSVSRMDISRFGLAECGRPPLFSFPRANISSVSSGSSTYSSSRILCFATLVRFDPKDRRDALLLSLICLPHTEYVTICTPWGVSHDNHPVRKHPEANEPLLPVVLERGRIYLRRPRKGTDPERGRIYLRRK